MIKTSQSFKSYINEAEHQKQIQMIEAKLGSLLYLSENFYMLQEHELNEVDVNKYLNKFGLKLHKEGPGLIDYIKDFTKGAGRLIIAAIKGNKEEVKKIATSISKEQVLDFLLKLDTATLHVVTGPIHTIDAVTGWDLWANIKGAAKKSKDILSDIWAALKALKDKVQKAFDDARRSSIMKQITAMEDMIPKPVTVKA